MLQRIQSVWMFLAILGSIFLMITSQEVSFFGNNMAPKAIAILLILLGIYSVFSFKNRKLQILLNKISIFINVLLIGLLMHWLLNLSGGIQFPEKGIEPIFPFLSIVFLLIANLLIGKDEKLVKSVDRLR